MAFEMLKKNQLNTCIRTKTVFELLIRTLFRRPYQRLTYTDNLMNVEHLTKNVSHYVCSKTTSRYVMMAVAKLAQPTTQHHFMKCTAVTTGTREASHLSQQQLCKAVPFCCSLSPVQEGVPTLMGLRGAPQTTEMGLRAAPQTTERSPFTRACRQRLLRSPQASPAARP